jgi:hypothetical protein
MNEVIYSFAALGMAVAFLLSVLVIGGILVSLGRAVVRAVRGWK